jgi:hypothetical protein
MPNVFPNSTTSLVPDIERRSSKAFDTRARAADGGLFINVPHSLVQALFHLEYSMLVDTDLDTVMAHFYANRSRSFTYFESTNRAMTDVAVGTGNGAAGQVITLPARNVSGLVIKVNGSTVANYTTSPSGGADGEMTITSTGGGFTNGGAITMSASNATTQRRRTIYYANIEAVEDPREANLYKLTIDLEEKLP